MLVVGVPTIAAAASFDCDKAATVTEVAICADPELSALDELMGALWVTLEPSDRVIAEQREWLEQRDDCGANKGCTVSLYRSRIQEFGWEVRGVFDHGQGKPEYFLYAEDFYAYQGSALLYRTQSTGDPLVAPSIFIPDLFFLEEISSCAIGSIDAEVLIEEIPFEDVLGVSLNSDIDISADVSTYIKWAGHGDQSHSVSYHLIDGEFRPYRIAFDSCLDLAFRQIEVIFAHQ
jgi:hypothetical protein